MNERLARYNLSCHEEGGDPDCWFHCVADQLNRYFIVSSGPRQTPLYTANTVRKKVYDYILRNYKNLDMAYLEEADIRPSKYPTNPEKFHEPLKMWIEKLRTDAWGNMYTTMMVPYIFEIPIRVWMTEPEDGSTDDFYEFVPPGYDYRRLDGCIELASIGRCHFQSVRPIGEDLASRFSPVLNPGTSGPMEYRSPGHGADNYY